VERKSVWVRVQASLCEVAIGRRVAGFRELEKKLNLAEKTIEVKELLAAYEEFRFGEF
jgi:hypothetical protein